MPKPTYKVTLDEDEIETPDTTPETNQPGTTNTTSQGDTTVPDNTSKTTQPDLSEIQSKLEGSITEKVQKSVVGKIAEALGLTKQEEEKLPTDPKELLKLVREESQRSAKEVLTEQEQEQDRQDQERQKQISEGAQQYQRLWRNQYEELATAGRVPKITNAQDANDPGNQARVRILTKLKQIIDENQKKGVDYVPTLKEVYYEYPDILKTETTAGATVPVSGGGRSTTPGSGLSYGQLHKTGFDELIREKYQ